MRSLLGLTCQFGFYSVAQSFGVGYNDELFCPAKTCLEYVKHDFQGPPWMFWECQDIGNPANAVPVKVWSFAEGQGAKDDLIRQGHHHNKCAGGLAERVSIGKLDKTFIVKAGKKGRKAAVTAAKENAKAAKGKKTPGMKAFKKFLRGKAGKKGKGRKGGKGKGRGKGWKRGIVWNETNVRTCKSEEGKGVSGTQLEKFMTTSHALCQTACEMKDECACYSFDKASKTKGDCVMSKKDCKLTTGAANGGFVSGTCGVLTNKELKAKIKKEKEEKEKAEQEKKKPAEQQSDKPAVEESEKADSSKRTCTSTEWGQVWKSKTYRKIRQVGASVCQTTCQLDTDCECWDWGNWGKKSGGTCYLRKGKCNLKCKRKAKDGVKTSGGVCTGSKAKKEAFDLTCEKPKLREEKKKAK